MATPADALQLLTRSSLKLEGLPRVAVLWPESQFALGASQPIDTVLGECSRAQRLVITSDDASVTDFLERHARRAPVVGAARAPEGPTGGRVRYALVDSQRLSWAVRTALDTLNPASAWLWDPRPSADQRWAEYDLDPTVSLDPGSPGEPVDWAIAAELPTADVLAGLHAAARDVLVLARPAQLPYLERLTRSLDVLRLPSEADRARDRAGAVRTELRSRIEGGELAGGLATLAPLFDEYDPALVAAAALRADQPTAARERRPARPDSTRRRGRRPPQRGGNPQGFDRPRGCAREFLARRSARGRGGAGVDGIGRCHTARPYRHGED